MSLSKRYRKSTVFTWWQFNVWKWFWVLYRLIWNEWSASRTTHRDTLMVSSSNNSARTHVHKFRMKWYITRRARMRQTYVHVICFLFLFCSRGGCMSLMSWHGRATGSRTCMVSVRMKGGVASQNLPRARAVTWADRFACTPRSI